MESHDLWIFKNVAELQSISKAADKLGYVQSNISQRIKSLEKELGVRLFERSHRGVILTGEGEILLDYAYKIINLMDEAKSSVNPIKWLNTLTIGAPQTISASRIPLLFSSFLNSHANIRVNLKTNDKEKLQEMLSFGEVDGVFTHGHYNQSQFDRVYSYEQRMALITPINENYHKESKPTFIVSSDPNCIYRDKMLQYARKSAGNKPVILEFDSLESILQAVHSGLGISILPTDILQNRKEIQVQNLELHETIKIDFIIKQRKQQTPSLRKFIRYLQES